MKKGRVFPFAALFLAALAAGLPSTLLARSQERDRQLRYVLFYMRRHDLPVNLGPTGAVGYACRNMLVVKGVAPRSPAHGVLRKYDLIVGASGAAFAEGADPRMALGKAITASETRAGQGRLTLSLLRDGAEQTAEVRLPVLGSYSPTWPFQCAKSQRILDAACRFLVDHSTPDRGMPSHREFNALLLLATGRVEYLDVIRRTVYRILDDPLTGGYQGWSRSFAGMLLGEYYLATGDPSVPPKLQYLAQATAQGQMRCGSWGHRMPWDGYGAVNQIGLMCFVSLALFQEAGIAVDPSAMRRSTEFFAKFAGKGWVPYGDHSPWRGTSGNGKNGSAAVVFDLLGSHPDAVAEFSKSVAGSYKYREVGHTGAFFGLAWGPLGAVKASKELFREFADYQTWYYDLARTHDGGIACQPNPENLSGRTPGHYTRAGAAWTTGGMALLYALPTKGLRMLGGAKGVFAQKPPASLRQARTLFNERKWSHVATFLQAYLEGRGASAAERAYARGLLEATTRLQQSADLTLQAIDANTRKGHLFLASEQLKALQRLLGQDSPRMAAFRRILESEEAAREIEIATDYYRARAHYLRRTRDWHRMQNVAKASKGYYSRLAAKALAGAQRPSDPPRWETVLTAADETLEQWRHFQWGASASDPLPKSLAGWTRPAFDASRWPSGEGPFGARGGKGTRWTKPKILLRKAFTLKDTNYSGLSLVMACGAGTQVYLNGFRLVEIVTTPRRPDEPIPLRDNAVELLEKGENLIAVYGVKGREGTLDITLRAARAR